MIYVINLLENYFIRDSFFNDIDGTLTSSSRKYYANGEEYDEYSLKLNVFIDDGNWFKKSMQFTIIINTCDYELVLLSGYNLDKTIYKISDFRKAYTYIKDAIAPNKEYSNDNFKILYK